MGVPKGNKKGAVAVIRLRPEHRDQRHTEWLWVPRQNPWGIVYRVALLQLE